MSEQEKQSGGGTGSSVVLVEQSAASRHKQAFRPIDMQEEAPPELHHKRSKAPAVPSVAENLKESLNTESQDRKECERAMSSEKHKHTVPKKVSSNKRRGSSPEAIPLKPLAVDSKKAQAYCRDSNFELSTPHLAALPTKISTSKLLQKAVLTPPSQPIPAQVASITSAESDLVTDKTVEDRKDEDDSITEEISELRTPEVAKISSEWAENSGDAKRKEVSWNDDDYLKKVKLNEEVLARKCQPCELERKSSIGPCFRSAAPFGRPSGISICLAKKSVSTIDEDYNPKKSVINITVSKKCLINKTIYRAEKESTVQDMDQNKEIQDVPKVHFLGILRERIANMGDKIKNAFV